MSHAILVNEAILDILYDMSLEETYSIDPGRDQKKYHLRMQNQNHIP